MPVERWTPAEDAALARCRADGLKFLACARRVGRSWRACARRAVLLGLRTRRRKGQLARQVRYWWARGVDDYTAAAALGLSQTTVQKKRRALGLPANGRDAGVGKSLAAARKGRVSGDD